MDYRETKGLDGQSCQGRYSKTHLIFYSHRIRRSGPRVLLQIAALTFAALLLLPLLPRTPWLVTSITGWCGKASRNAGNLRIVTFGSQDMLGSAERAQGKTWTEQLCKELNCYSHLSFVPKPGSGHGLVSNSLYARELQALEQRMNVTDFVESPASNYEFLFQQYPVPSQAPDLEAQIQEFLFRPAEPIAPRNTLWVFTFGTWDVWNLAALPRERGEQVIDAMVSNMFAQIELLYREALDPASVAYSDFWSGVSQSDVRRLTDADAPAKVDLRCLESFRVVVPELLDVTLSPGWQMRPDPPAPHSKANQMRNAVLLTKRWNAMVQEELRRWTARGSTRPKYTADEGFSISAHVARAASILEYLSAAFRFDDQDMGEAGAKTGVVYAPYPRRTGIQSNMATTVVDAMMVEEMRLFDLRGRPRGSTLRASSATRSPNTWDLCKHSDGDAESTEDACSHAKGRLFQDAFTLNGRAMKEAVRATVERVSEKLLKTS
ncbi:hypothetical protein HIM_08575 [Hirsutella minnesotensis 3608]|uniref:Uncharacterized protein n=1 Tax=Hirsutella minnesotensis 3608 TaxID=1043627 RepID=A0A0F8A3L0_9HYPO|nr:hypothetical protein HIM_08575 [Hirsutella minnesotensis 3608]